MSGHAVEKAPQDVESLENDRLLSIPLVTMSE
jgi:hypothetical protein